jgi:hypothetical protein
MFLFLGAVILLLCSCKKALQITPPVGTIVANNVFSSDIQATAAIDGLYFKMINTTASFSALGTSVFSGMSADELIPFDQNYADLTAQFQQDNLQTTNGLVYGSFWSDPYSVIYDANAIISGLQVASGVHDSVKSELTGEAEFVRAFCDFYLVNLFGNVPLVNSINYQKTSVLGRASVQEVYEAIVADLNDAKSKMATDYSVGQGQRIIPNRWAAMALLARVYLFQGDWSDAMTYSDSVIGNTGLYSMVSDPNSVFLANSNEAIWQLQQSNITAPYFNITPEADKLIPSHLNSNSNPPFAYLTTNLLESFEPGDLRQIDWIDSTLYENTEYYFPYKYKQGPADVMTGGAYVEYYMVLRLAEQFLIRAEAEANLGMASAASDLNVIRTRAGLPNYMGSSQQDSILAAIRHERQVELFAEWGHRWLDLKRTKTATSILSAEKGFAVSADALLYPIPQSELIVSPNLVQNGGY